MELLLSLLFSIGGIALFVLWIYAFVLLWGDKQFSDAAKIVGSILFLVIGPSAWVYLIYRMFR